MKYSLKTGSAHGVQTRQTAREGESKDWKIFDSKT